MKDKKAVQGKALRSYPQTLWKHTCVCPYKTSGQATWDTCTLEEPTGRGGGREFTCQVFAISFASGWLMPYSCVGLGK